MASLITTDGSKSVASRTLKDIYPVSRLVREARVTLENSFSLIWVEGEVSNLAMPASGHIYFTLKDEIAQVRCAMFRNRNRQLRFTPKNGMQVLIRARVTLYEGRGEFQLSVEHMEEAGSGALQRAYEALKFRLGDEGLFEQAHKKPLPSFPESIGIISSANGAALHDILTVLKRRFSAVNVIIYPVAVQGSDSVSQIAQAIALADKRKECDVLIVGRGGGSIEDLWSFNDEKVARAIFSCSLPIISAVGHEVDFTIADFVADVRAATPSAAAELAVPDSQELQQKVESLSRRLNQVIKQQFVRHSQRVNYLFKRLPQPQQKIYQHVQRLDRIEQQLSRSWGRLLVDKRQGLTNLALRLKHPQAKIEAQNYKLKSLNIRLDKAVALGIRQDKTNIKTLQQRVSQLSPLPMIKRQQDEMNQLSKRLNAGVERRINERKEHLAMQMRTLAAVSPLNTLDRGYSITTLADTGQVIHSVDDVKVQQQIQVRLNSGQLKCEVKEVKHD